MKFLDFFERSRLSDYWRSIGDFLSLNLLEMTDEFVEIRVSDLY
jgi:hypothetical protein